MFENIKALHYDENYEHYHTYYTKVKKPDKNLYDKLLTEFKIPESFPISVNKALLKIPLTISEDEIERRRDLRSVPTFTIDPEDAKDFDDALSFRYLDNDTYEIGIHIADVTYYIAKGDPIDTEAYKRATSIYLVDRCVPMLPELLSNNICSLVPYEDRLVVSVILKMDNKGNVLDEWIGRSVINSMRRFSYEEVQEYLDKGENDKSNFKTILDTLNSVALQLRENRLLSGSVAFESDEIKFTLDEKGFPIGVYKKVRTDSNKLIEEFMLLANKRVALYLKDNLNTVYRVHACPEITRLEFLRKFVNVFGYDVDIADSDNLKRNLNELLTAIEGKTGQDVIRSLAIRSMPKAVYSKNNIGHYGLGFSHYCHFTSPIRRYPDVMVHYLLNYILDYQNVSKVSVTENDCIHVSTMERLAVEAERASIKYKQVEYMSRYIGKYFDATVTGIAETGLFVSTVEGNCDGMIMKEYLPDRSYKVHEDKHTFIGSAGTSFRLGDVINVRLLKVNLQKRFIDFTYNKV